MNQSGSDANESVTHRPSGPLRRIQLQHYALAILSVGVALGASLVLEHFHFRVPSALLLLFAVAISSWYGGPGPAALAVLLSAITFYWYFVQPVRTFYVYWSEIPYFIIFTAFAALVSWLGTVRRRVEADLRQSRDVLREHASPLSPALRLAVIYAFFGALWILVSDRLSFYLVPDLQLAQRLQTYKGWFFIAVTSVLLWLLAKRFLSQVRAAEEALHRLNRKLQAISNCNQALLRATDEQSLLEEICRIVHEKAGYALAWVGYAEHDEAKSVRQVAWSGFEEGFLATVGITWADIGRGQGPAGTAVRTGQTCYMQDFATDPRFAPWRESVLRHGFLSGIGLPLKDEHGDAFGCLMIYSAQTNAFSPEEVRLLEELAGDMAFGIVTLRSRAARERAEEEVTLLSFALNNVREAALLIDETARFHYVNDEACQVLGYSRAELLGMGVADIDAEFPAERWSDHWRDLKAQRSLGFESRHRTQYGRIFPVAISANYFEYGGRAYDLALVRDITERKRAEEALRESETRFRTFVDYAGDAFFVYDLEQRTIVDVNRSACEGLGYTRQELIGNTPLAFHLDSNEAEMESVHDSAATGETVFSTHLHRRKDGSRFPVEVHSSVVSYGGHRFLLTVARDISDRVRAEQQREELRQLQADLAHLSRVSMLGELAASVSHELKQPIAAVALDAATCLRWLRRDHPDAHKAGEAASRIIDAANRADDIIDRLRSLYKKSPPKRELVDVNQTIHQMVALLLGEATRHAVSIRAEVAEGLPKINADGVQLQQILMNLMLNGIEAMHNSGGVLTVKSQLAQDGRVEVSVSDTGVGLPAGTADRIFDAFFTTKAQGSGMGLSISRSIVESHGGRIWATNNDGRGASFHFALPIAAEAPEPAAVS